MKSLFIALIFMLLSTYSYAEDVTFGFKGINLENNISTIDIKKYGCVESKYKNLADKNCFNDTETIAGFPIEFFIIGIYNDIIHTISIDVDPENFSAVSLSLENKYGKAEKNTNEIITRIGAKYENETFKWKNISQQMTFIKYNERIDRSTLTMMTNFSTEEFTRRKNAAAKLNSSDL